MGLKEQSIQIGTTIKTIIRNVYDVQNNEDLKLQTGYVNYDNQEILVWRPYNLIDMPLKAMWREGQWKNIYMLSMPNKKDSQYRGYNLVEYHENGVIEMLPEVTIRLTYEIRAYIKRQRGNA